MHRRICNASDLEGDIELVKCMLMLMMDVLTHLVLPGVIQAVGQAVDLEVGP